MNELSNARWYEPGAAQREPHMAVLVILNARWFMDGWFQDGTGELTREGGRPLQPEWAPPFRGFSWKSVW